jgi:glutathione S-transferase
MYTLYIANKNYSSWSLRPWVLMNVLGIPFEEKLVPFDKPAGTMQYRDLSPNGKLPCLVDGDTVVWESIAIVEYLAERHPGVWAEDPKARAWSRCAAAEMHAGFATLRDRCTMNVGIRVTLHDTPPALAADLERMAALWADGIARFGGPFLAGKSFTAVDAMFTAVAFRAQTYGVLGEPASRAYVDRLLALPAMQEWQRAALDETWREPSHEDEAKTTGRWTADLRATA